MNKQRKARLQNVVFRLNDCRNDLLDLALEESVAFENTPDALKETDEAQQREENASTMMDAYDDFENILETLESILDN